MSESDKISYEKLAELQAELKDARACVSICQQMKAEYQKDPNVIFKWTLQGRPVVYTSDELRAKAVEFVKEAITKIEGEVI